MNINRIFLPVALAITIMSVTPQVSFAAKYTGAPKIATGGSASYTPIATAINGWANSFDDATSGKKAMDNNTAIINQVEATLLAAGKDLITSDEYDTLADALAFWLDKCSAEWEDSGISGNHKHGGNIGDIKIGNKYLDNTDCIWRLRGTTSAPNDCKIQKSGDEAYGVLLYNGTRLVIYTNLSSLRITRATDGPDVMAGTNDGSKLLVLGRRGHIIEFDGASGEGYADPTSSADVEARKVFEKDTKTGSAVLVNGGAVMTAYTTFKNNDMDKDKNKFTYKESSSSSYTVSSLHGGAISVGSKVTGSTPKPTDSNVCTLAFFQTTFKNNSTNGRGGAIGEDSAYLNAGGGNDGLYINSCTFLGNWSKIHGGAVSMLIEQCGGKFEVRNSDFKYNVESIKGQDPEAYTTHGAAIFYKSYGTDVAKMAGCDFIGNLANGKSGGGAISNEGKLTINGCNFDGNVAYEGGGGAIVNRTHNANSDNVVCISITLENSKFINNKALGTTLDHNDGGALSLSLDRDETIDTGNKQTFVLDFNVKEGCVFKGNEAKKGGAMSISVTNRMSEYIIAHPEKLTSNLVIKTGVFEGNKALAVNGSESTTGLGGALYTYLSNVTVGEQGKTNLLEFSGNEAQNGAALAVQKGTLTLYGGEITGNTASKNGGAAYIEGNVNVEGAIINGNKATENGGALSIYGGGNLQMDGGTIGDMSSFNSAKNGGAIHIQGGNATLNGGSINYNEASCNGGGLYVVGGNIDLKGGNLTLNRAKGIDGVGGGGIYSKGGIVNIADNITIEKNASKNYGGAIFIDVGGVINVNSCHFKGNTANVAGTAIIQNGVMNVKGTPTFETDQTVHLPKAPETTLSAATDDYKYQVITKVGEIGADTKIPVTVDAPDDEYKGRDILVSKSGATTSANGMVVIADQPRIDMRLQSQALCTIYSESGLDAATYTPKSVIELADIARVRIIRKGLQIGESATYKVTDVTDGKNQLLFVLSLTGKKAEDSEEPAAQVERIITGIQPGAGEVLDIKVEETSWDWTYIKEDTSVDPSTSKVSAEKGSATGKLAEQQTLTFIFDASAKEKVFRHGEGQAINAFNKYNKLIITVEVNDWKDGGREHITY